MAMLLVYCIWICKDQQIIGFIQLHPLKLGLWISERPITSVTDANFDFHNRHLELFSINFHFKIKIMTLLRVKYLTFYLTNSVLEFKSGQVTIHHALEAFNDSGTSSAQTISSWINRIHTTEWNSLYTKSLLVPCLAIHAVGGNLPSIGHILPILLLWIPIELVPLSPLTVLNLSATNREK